MPKCRRIIAVSRIRAHLKKKSAFKSQGVVRPLTVLKCCTTSFYSQRKTNKVSLGAIASA